MYRHMSMLCVLCQEPNPDMCTECGHNYHTTCFQQCWKEHHLPCFECSKALGHAFCDENTLDWFVGVNSGAQWCACYKITAKESKIVRTSQTMRKWERKNGRLSSRNMFPMCFNICVS